MAEDLIRYDVLVQEALRGVVRKVVVEASKVGLPGEHHFFIAFDTTAPGVRISQRLKEKYPEEMTIVLQHQFWELVVHETWFEVGLSFDGVAEKLIVPFLAVKGFFDPSVQFGLQFEPEEAEDKGAGIPAMPMDVAMPEDASNTGSGTDENPNAETSTPAQSESGETKDDDGSAEVVSLDAFRKKP